MTDMNTGMPFWWVGSNPMNVVSPVQQQMNYQNEINARLNQSATNTVNTNNQLAQDTFQQGQDNFWNWSNNATQLNAAYTAANLAIGNAQPVGTYNGNALSPFAVGTQPIQHLGGTNGLQPFNPGSYFVANPDVFKAGADPWQHYNQFGQNEGRTGAWGNTTFDTSNYLANNPDVWHAGADPIQHWLTSGYDEGRQGGFGGPDFNEQNYLVNNPDVFKAGADPIQHYLQFGMGEGRQGGWGENPFNSQNYLANNPDVFKAGMDPTAHWLQFGSQEGRQGAWGDHDFNEQNYLANNPDVYRAGMDPTAHWLQFGSQEGRQGAWGENPFNSQNYLANNPDVFKAGADPFQHWLQFGSQEARQGAWGDHDFNEQNYLANNPDVFKAGMDPTAHWMQFGSQEGRQGAWGDHDFNEQNYLANNPDVFRAGADPLQHWLSSGYGEGRQGAWGENPFDTQNYLNHNIDVAASGMDPTAHWLQFGSQEGRQGAFGDDPFNAQEYLLQNRDVAASGMDPMQHWRQFGSQEGRDVAFGETEADDWSKYFSTATAGGGGTNTGRDAIAAAYILANPDVFKAAQASGQDPTQFANQHIMAYGEDEGRTFFDRFHYNQLYPDVAASGMDPTAHWFQFGQKEGRTMPQSSVFNMETYKLLNPDVAASGIDPLQHWLNFGQQENRMGGAFESAQSYFDAPGTTYRDPWIAAIPEGRRTAETVTAVKNLAEQYGWSPAAMAAVIFMETGNAGANSWNPLINFGSTQTDYRGLTQMGPNTFKEQPGGKLGGLTYEQYQRATPAQQIAAYGAWLDYYAKSPGSAAALVKGGIGTLPPEMQAAIMQATQFSPSGKNNGVSWVDALGQGNMSMAVTGSPQAEILKPYTIENMRNVFADMMMRWPQNQSPWPLQ